MTARLYRSRAPPILLSQIVFKRARGGFFMGKNKNIRYRMCRILESQLRIGTKKTADKEAQKRKTGEHKATYIHSVKTTEDYMQYTKDFGDWLLARNMGHCTLDEAKGCVTRKSIFEFYPVGRGKRFRKAKPYHLKRRSFPTPSPYRVYL